MSSQKHPPPPPKILVLGLGKTGYSVVEYLAARGARITAADSRELPPFLAQVRERHPAVEVITGGFPQERFGEFDRIVVSPGIAPPAVAAAAGSDNAAAPRLIGDIELFASHLRETGDETPVIAVTGSNGKSTVTTMVDLFLEDAGHIVLSGGNLGRPALELLDRGYTIDCYILELSSFQLETTHTFAPAAAAILNLTEDHLDRHPDMRSYAAAKARILERAAARVLNRDDPGLAELRAAYPDAVTFGLGRPPRECDYGIMETARGRFLCRGRTPLVDAAPLVAHNAANALAALALIECAGFKFSGTMTHSLFDWRGLPHHIDTVAVIGGVEWINDSKATNVGATVAAIAGGFAIDPADESAGDSGDPDSIVLIAGGLGKGADFTPLREPVSRHVSCAILFGRDAPRLAAALDGCTRIVFADDLRAAVKLAADVAQPDQTVLFSPACASFDQFDDYEARGLAFTQLVGELKQAHELEQAP